MRLRLDDMSRRGFFAKFAGLIAAVPIVGKLVRRPILNPAYDAAGNMTLQIRNFRAEDYIGTWKWGPGTAIEYRDGKRLRIMHGWRTVRYYDYATGVITDGDELI